MSSTKPPPALAYKDYIDTIEAVDPQTVLVKAKLDADGKAVNPLLVAGFPEQPTMSIQKAWTQTLEARAAERCHCFESRSR